MIESIAHITFPSHSVHISRDDLGTVHLFKYDDATCDFNIFTDQDEAADWLRLPPDTLTYRVVFPGDESE